MGRVGEVGVASICSLMEAMVYPSCSADETERRRPMSLGLRLISQDSMTVPNPARRIGGRIADMLIVYPARGREAPVE